MKVKKFDFINIQIELSQYYLQREIFTQKFKGSKLESIFSQPDKSHFKLDRKPVLFNNVIDFLRQSD